jgi:transcriptional regulator with XRE-family HTH domain
VPSSSKPKANHPGVIKGLSARLKLIRTIHQLSLAELAAHTELTKSYLSKVERGASEPSLNTLLKLGNYYGMTTSQLIGEDTEGEDPRLLLIRRNERVPFQKLAGYDGYVFEAIASKRSHKTMLPFVMRPPPRSSVKKIQLASHSGEELIYVLSGEVEFFTTGQSIKLQAGDALYFDASVPHRSFSTGKLPAEALLVIAGGEHARRQ